MDLMKQREEVLNYCKVANAKKDEIIKSDKHVLIKKMAEQIHKRTKEINEICSVEKYNLFFNGKVAIGKSTIISTLFDLIDRDLLGEGTRLSSSLLLKTGSGRTTVCETHIIPHSDASEIIIEEVPYEKFCIYLKEFCNSISGKESDISEEETRLIKNMSNIPLKFSNEDIIQWFPDNVNDIYEYLKSIIDYQGRTTKKFICGPQPFKKWLKDTFSDINDGRIKETPMPNKIIIHISDKDFNIQLPEYIKSIVDTRGLDGGERVDIQKYIAEKNSISFMCDEVNGYGGNESIISILKQVLIKEDKDKNKRVILLGMEKGKELENITNFEDDRNGGIKEKKHQANKKMRDNNINFLEDNFCFFNTAAGIGIQDNKVFSINSDALHSSQTDFLNTIESTLHNMYSGYYDELCDSLKTLNRLADGKITENTLRKFEESKQVVFKTKSKVENTNNHIIQKFQESIRSIYHSSLRGAVNHLGVGNTADVYGSFQKCGGEEFNDRCNVNKAEIKVLIEKIFEGGSLLEDICLQNIQNEIDALYLKYYEMNRNSFYQETYNSLYNYNSWQSPQQYWGDGLSNYNLRVWKDISYEIKNKQIDIKLINLNNEIRLFNDIISFLTLN